MLLEFDEIRDLKFCTKLEKFLCEWKIFFTIFVVSPISLDDASSCTWKMFIKTHLELFSIFVSGFLNPRINFDIVVIP